jgi:hypothetical protein
MTTEPRASAPQAEMDWEFHATELDAIERMAKAKGGTKKDGTPFTREDAKEVLRVLYA